MARSDGIPCISAKKLRLTTGKIGNAPTRAEDFDCGKQCVYGHNTR